MLARTVDGPARKVRKTYEDKVEEPLRQAYAKVAKARFAIEGDNTYPDATFTLRLAFGTVKGYEEDGEKMPPWTTIGGAYEHAAEARQPPPFELPADWQKDKDKLNLDTPFNFVCTADIIGGNSGSPVVNRDGRIGRHHLRRQHPVAGARLRLHRRTGPSHLGPLQKTPPGKEKKRGRKKPKASFSASGPGPMPRVCVGMRAGQAPTSPGGWGLSPLVF